jgi:hypothetical protein
MWFQVPEPPPPCNGAAQITDVAGDGHHSSSDVLAAWFSEAAGRLQAVIQVRAGAFVPEHDDAEINGSGFAFVFTRNGRVEYVRTRAAPDGSLTYDSGTYAGGTFTSLGATTGSVARSTGAGTTTIEIPGAAAGSILSAPFVLTYDGITRGVPAWVDHAPGGEAPDDPARGADYVVGACGAPSPSGPAPVATTAVLLSVPRTLTGGGRVIADGRVVPPRPGVDVTISHSGHSTRVTTEDDGSYAAILTVREITRVDALAGGIHAGTQTIDVRSRTRIRRRGRSLAGTVAPALPGRALLLRSGSPSVLASRRVAAGRFRFRLARSAHGAYQVVYVPAHGRAERSTSNTVHVR